MGSKEYSYGLFTENTLLVDTAKGLTQKTALLGQLVRILHRQKCQGTSNVVVRTLKDNGSWESTTFVAPRQKIVDVHEDLWEFMVAIGSPVERLKLARNKEKCEKLLGISAEMVVGFSCSNDVMLGTIKYIGYVIGIGKCVGLQLHEKKPNNRCNGSCAGVQYFTCLPGYGVFATIETINPFNTPISEKETQTKPEIDSRSDNLTSMYLEKVNSDIPKYEEIITKYGEYESKPTKSPNNPSNLRNALSLQNILDFDAATVNTNNDFDNNTIIPPDKTYLTHEGQKKIRNKSEMDLIDVIGGTWSGTTDKKELEAYSQLKKNLDNCDLRDKTSCDVKHVRNKSPKATFVSHIAENGSATNTLPKKSKSNVPIIRKPTPKKDDKKLNEKSEALAKASSSKISEKSKFHPPPAGATDLTIGTLVEVFHEVSNELLYGVVRWIGIEAGTSSILVGVELEEEQSHLPLTLNDGVHKGERLFKCGENRGLCVKLEQCHKDSRFQDGVSSPVHQSSDKGFEKAEDLVIKGAIAPLCMPTEEDVEAVCGKYRGIQGHHNSCYLDVTLFSMFTYTGAFDSLLFRPKDANDIADYEEVQRVLREEIVNPLRKNLFVSAGNVMKLRKLLDKLSSVSGLTSEEKDPEEFLNSLLAQILKAEPFLKLNSGQEAYYYQLFIEKDPHLNLPTVQQLFEQSFLTSNVKLKEVPSCLIIQMPRFGKNYKMYPRILPSQLLDVTDIIEASPRQCFVCGKLARWECRECFDNSSNTGLEGTAFCSDCLKTSHRHEKRSHHKPSPLEVTPDFAMLEDHCRPPRLYMELFAVICIETSHYVAFVKCGVGHEAPWCFFDSMADRKGERNGYNIPEMVACPDISKWLSDETLCRQLHEEFPNDRHLPEHARRLLCDAYICMYQSPDVIMYR